MLYLFFLGKQLNWLNILEEENSLNLCLILLFYLKNVWRCWSRKMSDAPVGTDGMLEWETVECFNGWCWNALVKNVGWFYWAVLKFFRRKCWNARGKMLENCGNIWESWKSGTQKRQTYLGLGRSEFRKLCNNWGGIDRNYYIEEVEYLSRAVDLNWNGLE